MLFRTVFAISLFCLCEGIHVPTVVGYGGETTTVVCTGAGIVMGSEYIWIKNSSVIYSKVNEGTVQLEKYNGSTQTGQISLQVFDTVISDAGQYNCNHNFDDAAGTVYVAYIPQRIAYTVARGDVLQLTILAVKVYPNGSNITSVLCNNQVSSAIELFTANQSIISNNEDTFLFDINWIGTTANVLLTGDYVCTVHFMLINPYVTNVNVSFTEVLSSIGIPTKTSPAAATTEKPEKDEIKWWLIFLIVAAVCVAVAVGVFFYKKWRGKRDLPEPKPDPEIKMNHVHREDADTQQPLIEISETAMCLSASKAKSTHKKVTNVELAEITSNSSTPIDGSNSEEERKSKTANETVANEDLPAFTPNSPDPMQNIDYTQITSNVRSRTWKTK